MSTINFWAVMEELEDYGVRSWPRGFATFLGHVTPEMAGIAECDCTLCTTYALCVLYLKRENQTALRFELIRLSRLLERKMRERDARLVREGRDVVPLG